jgi:hypothetical protein
MLLAGRDDDGQHVSRDRGCRGRLSSSCSDDLCFLDDDVHRLHRIRDHGRRSAIAIRAARGLRLGALFMPELLP